MESQEGAKIEQGFASQFGRVERVKVVGGTAEVIDMKPQKPKTEVPVFFAPAWSQTAAVYKPALETLSETNRRVITINHPRIGSSMKDLVTDEDREKFPKEGLRKALNILGVLEQKGIEKTDAIAHSEGALNVVIAATLHPEKFRNIVLFAPSGLIGEDTFTRLLKGFAAQGKRPDTWNANWPITDANGNAAGTKEDVEKKLADLASPENKINYPEIPVNETEKEVQKVAVTEALKYMAKNPVRSINEGRGMAQDKSQIHEMLKELHKKGVGIVVMSGVDDPVFQLRKCLTW